MAPPAGWGTELFNIYSGCRGKWQRKRRGMGGGRVHLSPVLGVTI